VRYAITFAPEVLEDLKRVPRTDARTILHAIELHLRHAPELISKSRIKRLRVDEWRVFYDIVEGDAWIRGVVRKPDANAWLSQLESRHEKSAAIRS
jgi:mRNA-degrading endonuclease RelE of RelBE toxin-antitoxin system